MRNIEVSRDMLFTLKEKSFSSDLEGKYGVVFPFGNKVIKMDKFAINEIVHSKTICFNPKRNQTYDLLHDLGKKQESIRLVDFPISTLTYNGNYFGNVQISYLNYTKMRDLITENRLTFRFLKKHLLDTLEIIKELSDNDIEYTDLHPSNLMVNRTKTKLIDFDDSDRVQLSTEAKKVNYDRMLIYIGFYQKIIKLRNMNYDELKEYIDGITLDSLKNGIVKTR